MKKQILIINIVFWSFFSANAQINKDIINDLNFDGKYHYGLIFPHHQSISYLLDKKNISGFELSISKQTKGKKLWHQIYKYPEIGISYSRTTLSNEKIFGLANVFYSYINAPIKRTKIFNINYKLGTGFAFVSKPFDLQSNNMNVAIGSHTNFYFLLGLETKLFLSKNLKLTTGVSLNHFSNGNIHRPNLGINYLTIYGGLKYSINNDSKFIENDIEFKRKSPFMGAVICSIGAKRMEANDEKPYIAFSVSATIERDMSNRFRLGAGIDVFYDSSAEAQLKGKKDEINDIDYYYSGFHISQSVVINKFSFSLHEGYYLFLKNRITEQYLYNRLVLKYRITDNLILSAGVKSHLGVADYIEWGVGYHWD